MKARLMLIALIAVALVGAACGGDDNGSGGSDAAGDGGGGGEAVTLTAVDFKFEPTSISAAAGGSIEFTNEDSAAHSLTAEEAGIDEVADPESSATIDLANAEAGTYDFVCKFHTQMKGTLEITG